jgi:hypothetical protein
VVVADADGALFAFDAGSGNQLWRGQADHHGVARGRFVLTNDYLADATAGDSTRCVPRD